MSDVGGFYDSLAADYHRLFAGWQASAARHGRALQALIESAIGGGSLSVLDCACGIGTQLIGLAPFGHRLHGTDLSPVALTRADQECRARGITVQLRQADMRLLPHEDATFEVLVCVDNALPHLLTAADVTSAFAQWARVLRPGGLAIVTTREYDELLAHRPTTTPAQRSTDDAGLRTVTVQLWDWDDDHPVYQLTHLQTVEQPDRAWRTQARTTTYRAWTREELRGLAADAGLHASTWLTAAQAGLHQQTLLLRR